MDQSTRAVSRTGRHGILSGYAYLWWTNAEAGPNDPEFGAYTAAGNGGRYITVLPRLNAVVATQPWEEEGQPQAKVYTDKTAYDRLLRTLIAAAGEG